MMLRDIGLLFFWATLYCANFTSLLHISL